MRIWGPRVSRLNLRPPPTGGMDVALSSSPRVNDPPSLVRSCGTRSRRGGLGAQARRKISDRDRAELALFARARSERAGGGFLVADHDDVGMAHQARVADLRAELVGTRIDRYAQP